MKPLNSLSFCTLLLSLCRISIADELYNFDNNTISGSAPPFIFSKRTTCSGTCAECYGTGSVFCGDSLACFNPTIGESCCAQYSYSCPKGYYCAPGGQNQQCCDDSISSNACSNSINNGGLATSSGLSTGAMAGIGAGVVLLILIIVGLVTWLLIRRRNRNRNRNRNPPAPVPGQYQMPELSNGPPPTYSTDANYGAGPSDYSGMDGKSTQVGVGGGPPVASFYTPGNGPQKAGYNAFVPSHAELAETPPVHGASPTMQYSYPPHAMQHENARATEMYGGYAAHELNE